MGAIIENSSRCVERMVLNTRIPFPSQCLVVVGFDPERIDSERIRMAIKVYFGGP